jgi:tRNA-uridine 2-sulfurtransferase
MNLLGNKKHIVVGLSGGVDSSVTAALLKEQGHHVRAIFMQNWKNEESNTQCSATQDLSDAQQIAHKLDIPFEVVDFSDAYWHEVFEKMLSDLAKGLTPNPDVLCNQKIKFRVFLDYARSQGADAIATGHYAQIKHHKEKGYTLHKGMDPSKDQSYFLAQLTEEQLTYSLFPIGSLHKQAVRQKARSLGLHTSDKKDSTGICFIGAKRFKPFMETYMLRKPGPIVTLDGQQIGTHDGLAYYTIGQRQGLNIGGLSFSQQLPWYVIKKDIKKRELIVAQGRDHPQLQRKNVPLNSIHWINYKPSDSILMTLEAKLRYRQLTAPCLLKTEDKRYFLNFQTPQWAVTPGQLAVLYSGTECLGSGFIAQT